MFRHSFIKLLRLVLVVLMGLVSVALQPAFLVADELPAVRWSERVTARGDVGRWLEIDSDGGIRLHTPAHLRNAGDFRVQLDAHESRALLEGLIHDGLLNFDRRRVTAELRRRRSAEVPSVSGAALSVIQLRLDPLLAGDLTATTPRAIEIRWRGVRWDAAHHPEISALAGLARAHERLIALFEHPRLERLPTPDAAGSTGAEP